MKINNSKNDITKNKANLILSTFNISLNFTFILFLFYLFFNSNIFIPDKEK